jgi:hypothetical protein
LLTLLLFSRGLLLLLTLLRLRRLVTHVGCLLGSGERFWGVGDPWHDRRLSSLVFE